MICFKFKPKTLILLLLFMALLSCDSSNEEASQKQEALLLDQMLIEIKNIAYSQKCTVNTDWKFTSYGSKACGGPLGYIAYHKTVDEFMFFAKIEEHQLAQNNFNIKWNIVSDCSLPVEPIGVECGDGIPVLVN